MLNRRPQTFIVDNTKPQRANKVKKYGKTIQQSHQKQTPGNLSQTQKGGGSVQKNLSSAGVTAPGGMTRV
jgi:hypothetical protein